MQLSQTAEYALRAVVYLAEHRGEAKTTQQIAEGCRIPAGYLSKVLQPLTRAGVVSAQRGLGGGYVLEHDPAVLTLLEVVSAVESIQRFRTCPVRGAGSAGASAGGGGLCGLHRALDRVMAGVERSLAAVTVGSLVGPVTGVRALCEGAAMEWGLAVTGGGEAGTSAVGGCGDGGCGEGRSG